jgi:hypothetical protein
MKHYKSIQSHCTHMHTWESYEIKYTENIKASY